MADFLTFGICLVVAYLIFAGFLMVFLAVIHDIKLKEWFKGWDAAMSHQIEEEVASDDPSD